MIDYTPTARDFEFVCQLPTRWPIIELRRDGDDLIAEAANGEIYRIASDGRIKAN